MFNVLGGRSEDGGGCWDWKGEGSKEGRKLKSGNEIFSD